MKKIGSTIVSIFVFLVIIIAIAVIAIGRFMDIPTLTLIATVVLVELTAILLLYSRNLVKSTNNLSAATDHLAKIQVQPKVRLDHELEYTQSGILPIAVINRGTGGAFGTKVYLKVGDSPFVQAKPYEEVDLAPSVGRSFWAEGIEKGHPIQIRIIYSDIEGAPYEENPPVIRYL